MVFAVSSKSTAKSMKEIEKDAKKDPENFTWASLGGAGMQDLGTRQFLKAIGVDVWKTKPIMFKGGAPAVAATAGGNVKLGSGTTTAMLPAYKGGVVRPLGITSKGKHPDYPDTPTMAEQGYPTVTCTWWMGITGPPKLPSHIVDKWNEAMTEILKDADVVSKLERAGSTPYYLNSSDFKKYVVAETEEVTKLWVK
jgi:tripartite-type tricarboxylate transporter receptor subunit TctC